MAWNAFNLVNYYKWSVYYFIIAQIQASSCIVMILGLRKINIVGNNSGKPQPIRAKFGTRVQIKGRQRSKNFGRDRPSCGEMLGSNVSRAAGVFLSPICGDFSRQLSNGRFLPNYATTCQSVPSTRFLKGIGENFPFRCYLPQKPQN